MWSSENDVNVDRIDWFFWTVFNASFVSQNELTFLTWDWKFENKNIKISKKNNKRAKSKERELSNGVSKFDNKNHESNKLLSCVINDDK